MRPVAVLTCDAAFYRPLAAVLASLSFHHKTAGCRAIILHADLPAQLMTQITAVVEPPSTVEWRRVEDRLLDGCPAPRHLPRSSLYTLTIPDLVPLDVERAIYLDVDTIVRRPLTELWETPLLGAAAGAVRGAFMPWVAAVDRFPWRGLGLAPDTPYFNNGVMLIDILRWREDGVSNGAIQLLKQHDLPYGEQDALNIVLSGGWHRLHPRWNVQTGHFADPALAWVVEPAHQLDDALADPAIVHYNGPLKPWHGHCAHRWAAEWTGWIAKTRFVASGAGQQLDVAVNDIPPGPFEDDSAGVE